MLSPHTLTFFSFSKHQFLLQISAKMSSEKVFRKALWTSEPLQRLHFFNIYLFIMIFPEMQIQFSHHQMGTYTPLFNE